MLTMRSYAVEPLCMDVGRRIRRRSLLGGGLVLLLLLPSCMSRGQRVTPHLAPPPQLAAGEMAKQGETVNRPLAPDRIRFGLPPVTIAALTDEVAQDMGWKEHFVLHEERERSYTVVMSEGTPLGIQRRVSITPTDIGSEVLIFPPDEGIAARLRDRVLSYLTEPTTADFETGPQIKRFSRPFAQVWRAVKLTIIDGGFSFKTVDDDVGFIETERVPLGKASRSWFRGVGQLGLVAHPPSTSYHYASVEWRYRIRATPLGTSRTEVSVEAVVEATPDSSTLARLTSGTLDVLSVPFGSWISSAATGSRSSRLLLPSRGKLEQEFFAGLATHLPGQKKGHQKASQQGTMRSYGQPDVSTVARVRGWGARSLPTIPEETINVNASSTL